MGEQITWRPQERQKLFLRSQAQELLYGGQAGGGKSDVLLTFHIARRVKYAGSTGLILRRTLPELERGDGLIPRSKALLTGNAAWSERRKAWEFPNKSVLEFGYCDTDADVYRYQGAQYADIGFDELTQFTKYQFDYLRSRCRTTISNCPAVMRMTSNPGGVGHAWVKREFIKPIGVDPCPYPQGGEWRVDVGDGTTISRGFIPAKLSDNQYLSGTNYKQSLMLMDPVLREALMNGNWDLMSGNYFKNFGPANICKREFKPEYAIILGIDWGYAAPFCCLWSFVDDRGRVHVFRELYRSEMLDEEQAHSVVKLTRERRMDQVLVKADPSCWNKRSETGRSIAEVWAANGLFAQKANNERIKGWSRLRSMIETDIDGIRAFTVDPSCKHLIEQLYDLVHDAKDVEDVDTKQEDHAADPARYIVSDYRFDGLVKRPVREFNIVEYLNRPQPGNLMDKIINMEVRV